MKYTKLFNNHSEYEEYMASDNAALPNLSWCIQEDEGHFTPYVIETKLVAKFNVTSTSEPTRIIGIMKGSIYHASSIEIDGVEQPSVVTGYTFDTLGEHTVKYTLADDSTFSTMLTYCTDMTEVTIPNTVTSIGDSAFYGCTSLTSVTIPNSVTKIGSDAFNGCTSLTSITIPYGVTSIGRWAFYKCSGLTSIDIPSGVTSIDYYVFSNCTSLSSITVDSNNAKFDSRNNCNGIIDTATNTLVAGCKNTIIPSTVTSIGDYAFAECANLTSITIPDSVTSIGEGAFIYCSGLTSIDIPSGVTSIGHYVFSVCNSLSSITVDGDNATFDSRNNCNAVIETSTNTLVAGCKNTIIPSTVTSIGDYAFYGCEDLTSIDITSGVTSIGRNVFENCSSLTSITIPNNVTSINHQAFRSCNALESVEISDGVETIGVGVFGYCDSLTDVIIGTGITGIGSSSFYGSNNLESITILSTTPPALGSEMFTSNKFTIYVPAESVSAYKAADRWSNYSNRIQPLGCTPGHVYTLIGNPTYPSTVAATATSFQMSFDYDDEYTSPACESSTTSGSSTVLVTITANPTTSARTISGSYDFDGLSVPYSLTQEGQPDVPYSQQYLTFDVLTGGTINWTAMNNVTKTISYSINGGEWTEITASSTGTPINVSDGDKVRLKGNNTRYSTGVKDNASCFSGGTAYYNIEGNIMSLIGGDNFTGLTSFSTSWVFHDLFNTSKAVSAENLILPVTTLTTCCYRAMFAHSKSLIKAPALPATTLWDACYWYMFQDCAIIEAPELNATTLVKECYGGMLNGCSNLNYIKCLATSISATDCLRDWVGGVAATGKFVKDANTSWTRGLNGIPTRWIVQDYGTPDAPTISCNGFEIELSCATTGAGIYYQLDHSGNYTQYTTVITMTGDTYIECYAEKNNLSSTTTSMTCEYDDRTIYEYSNQSITSWTRNSSAITTPYSVNAIDGHSGSYAKGTFDFETSVNLRQTEPTYLWFQHADQSASIYVDNTLVEKHWGGYAAFTVDLTNYAHKGTNNIKVALKNNEGSYLAPAAGDFNFNATLGNVKLFTSPYVPAMSYGYDGFHITSTVSSAEATIYVKTSIPTGATVTCTISGTNCNYTATSASTGEEMIFTTTITNPHLWNGTIDPYLYTVKLDVSHNNELYHSYIRPYGLRFFEYVINDTEKYGTAGNPYTGFLLNGSPYLLRGVCMHDDLANKANALNDTDYTQEFNIITELGCNFLRLAHYPHPKEVYDRCDQLGIVVQTEAPWVNKSTSVMPEDYWSRLSGQCEDMVNQHYNHPCIMFWGVGNEINTSYDSGEFVKGKIEGYRTLIRSLLPGALVGYTVSHGAQNALSVFKYPTVDWVGNNIYVGWYISQDSNNPTSRLNTAINGATGHSTPCAFTEYGCGGTQRCHSDDFMTTTTRGNNPRHDIEYMMWLHEGHIAAIKNKPELLFTSQWQLFDIAVWNRTEGYKVCLDGVNVTDDNNLKFLNNKGLVERDHITKKDTFYLYKAWWNTTDKFVHICGKNYTNTTSRVIKCYTNDGNSLTLYVNGTSAETVTVTDNIATFTARNFNGGDTVMVSGATSNDSFTFEIQHDYVEIGGVKWATMNIGATGLTDGGLYFQWADTSGYTAEQVGRGEGLKRFMWPDYKYSDNGSSTAMTKYNTSDGKTVLDSSDDAAKAYWGNGWRMPTKAEFESLLDATTSEAEIQTITGKLMYYVFTDKTDNTKQLILPAGGCAREDEVGSYGYYWSNTRHNTYTIGTGLSFTKTTSPFITGDPRYYGFNIRPVKNV